MIEPTLNDCAGHPSTRPESTQRASTVPAPSITLRISGMDCAHCARTVEEGVGQLPGVEACRVSFTTERLLLTGTVDRAEVEARVRELGYGVATDEAMELRSARNFFAYLRQTRAYTFALLAALLILPGLLLTELLGLEHWLINLCSVAALLLAGGPVARSGWRNLRVNRSININMLMTIAAVGALAIGAYTEAGMVMTLFAIGEALEGYTADRARQAIRSFVGLTPREALHIDEYGRQQVVAVDVLAPGDRILVKPGALIAMDGTVLNGASAVNQAPITGESIPVDVERGSIVFAGAVNGNGALEIEVTAYAEDNTLSRIARLVRDAQEAQAPTQRMVDRFAAVYTPLVVLTAVLVATVPPLLFGLPFFNPSDGSFGWFYRALALLVVACPCALVISTPVTVISALANAAHQGILIKGGAILERLPAIRTLALDKTGTITSGAPSVVSVRALACPYPDEALHPPICAPCDELLALASALEERSEHPVARAVVAESSRRGVLNRYHTARNVTALAGLGVRGTILEGGSARSILIGSHPYFDSHIVHDDLHCRRAHSEAVQGRTAVMVSSDGEYAGTITLADTLRESTAGALHELRDAGITYIALLTGDLPEVAAGITRSLDIDEIHAALLPEDKIQRVEQLRAEHGPVAMIGDGINDAPALAAADVGIALGGAQVGTAQAMETADITIISDDLHRLPQLMRLARLTTRTLRANIAFSIGVKLLFMALVIGGIGTMWMAVLADVGTALVVTLNGMRLLRRRL